MKQTKQTPKTDWAELLSWLCIKAQNFRASQSLACMRYCVHAERKRQREIKEWKREGTKSENEKAKEQVWHCTLVAALVNVTFSCYLGCGCQERQIPRSSPGAELEHLNSQRLRKAYIPPPILNTFLQKDYQDHPEQLHQYMIVKLHKIRLKDCVAESENSWEALSSITESESDFHCICKASSVAGFADDSTHPSFRPSLPDCAGLSSQCINMLKPLSHRRLCSEFTHSHHGFSANLGNFNDFFELLFFSVV